MKKSEAIRILSNIIALHTKSIIWTDAGLAADILRKIEEIDMLPPPYSGKYDTVPTVTPTGNLNYSWIREWESEDA